MLREVPSTEKNLDGLFLDAIIHIRELGPSDFATGLPHAEARILFSSFIQLNSPGLSLLQPELLAKQETVRLFFPASLLPCFCPCRGSPSELGV